MGMSEKDRFGAMVSGFRGKQPEALIQGVEMSMGQKEAVSGKHQGSPGGKGKVRVSVSPDDKPGHSGTPGNPGQILRPVSQEDRRIKMPFPGPVQNLPKRRNMTVGIGNNQNIRNRHFFHLNKKIKMI
jgi:hypothetical protein